MSCGFIQGQMWGYGVVREGSVCAGGDVGMQEPSPGRLQLCLASQERSPLCGNHLLLKLGAAEVVKGAPVFPFSVSQFYLLENLNVVQAEPFLARTEVQKDHSRHGALPCSLWKEFKKRQTQMYVGSAKW